MGEDARRDQGDLRLPGPHWQIRGRSDRQRRLRILDQRRRIGTERLPNERQANRDQRVRDVRGSWAQEGTDVRPGDTFNLDYSVTHTIALTKEADLQLGLIGYEQRQTSDKSGPAISAKESSARYAINSFGVAANINLPARKSSLGLKYFDECQQVHLSGLRAADLRLTHVLMARVARQRGGAS